MTPVLDALAVLNPPPPPSAGHALASWLLGILILLVLIAVVVELAMWRRFREIRAMFDRALNSGDSVDDAIEDVRKAGKATSERVTIVSGRVDRLEGEVERLSAFHPAGEQPPKEA